MLLIRESAHRSYFFDTAIGDGCIRHTGERRWTTPRTIAENAFTSRTCTGFRNEVSTGFIDHPTTNLKDRKPSGQPLAARLQSCLRTVTSLLDCEVGKVQTPGNKLPHIFENLYEVIYLYNCIFYLFPFASGGFFVLKNNRQDECRHSYRSTISKLRSCGARNQRWRRTWSVTLSPGRLSQVTTRRSARSATDSPLMATI